MKCYVSKSVVAFVMALLIFAYQFLSLWGSGFPESSRILFCSGVVSSVYLIAAVCSFRRVRVRVSVSIIVALILGAWTLRTFGLHSYGVAGGNGLIFRDYFCGDVKYCMDVLFHSSIVEAIKNFTVASTLIGSLEPISYHLGSHWVMAAIAKVAGVSGMAMVGCLFPVAFIPLVSITIIWIIERMRMCLGVNPRLSVCDASILLLFLLVPGHVVPLFVYFTHSESCLLGSVFMMLGFSLLPCMVEAAEGMLSHLKRAFVLFVLVPLLILYATFSKVSSGFSLCMAVGAVLLCSLDWRNLRKNGVLFLAGMSYVILFGCLCWCVNGNQSAVMSKNYGLNFLEFGWRCLCNPVSTVFSALPLLAFLIPMRSSAGKRVQIVFLTAIFSSYVPYVFLRVHGGSEFYFWVNCQLLAVVYFVVIGLPERCMFFLHRLKWRLGGYAIILCAFIVYAILPLSPCVSAIKTALVQPRPNRIVLQSVRFQEMEKARQFVLEKGHGNVVAYVTKEYWTSMSSAERMSKAYVFAVQAYLGIPVIGAVRSDAHNIYALKSGQWNSLELPASYFMDRYLQSVIPEYSLDSAIAYARNNHYRYLLICGANDKIEVCDTSKSEMQVEL